LSPFNPTMSCLSIIRARDHNDGFLVTTTALSNGMSDK